MQLQNIDQGFAALIKRMEEKRDSLKEEFKTKYVTEASAMINKIHTLDQYNNDINNIEIVYEELSKFIYKNTDAKIWAKINDISSFISKSIEDLEKITSAKVFDKADAFIKSDLKPLTLNIDKAYEIIGKFNLISSKPAKKPQAKAPKMADSALVQPRDRDGYYESNHPSNRNPSTNIANSQQYDIRDTS